MQLIVSELDDCFQVLTSEHVDAQRILLMLPADQLPEVRALLLERIGKHQEALRYPLAHLHHALVTNLGAKKCIIYCAQFITGISNWNRQLEMQEGVLAAATTELLPLLS